MEETTKNNDASVNFGNDWFGLGDNSLTPTPTPEQLSSMSQETPVQGANEGVKQDFDFGSYATGADYSFLDTSNDNSFQIGEDLSDDGYDKSMYEFAKNQLDDNSDFSMGLIEAEDNLENLKRRLKRNQDLADKVKNKSSTSNMDSFFDIDNTPSEYDTAMKRVKEAEESVNKAQKTYDDFISRRDNLQQYVDIFKDRYSQEPKEEDIYEAYKTAEKAYKDAGAAVLKAYANLYAATDQSETIRNGFDYSKRTFTPGQNEYTDEYGNEYTTDISVFGNKVTIVTSVYSNDGEFGKSIIQTTNDFKGLEDALTQAIENEKSADANVSDLTNQYNSAKASFDALNISDRDTAAREAERVAAEKYKSGEYNALDYANALEKAKRFRSTLRPIDEADKARSSIAEADTSTELGTEARAIYNNISKWAKSYREKVDAIDVSNVDESNYKSIENNLYNTLKDLQEDAKIQIENVAKEFFEKGSSLDDFRNSDEIKTFSQELFNLAQDIYDKAETINHSAATNIQRDYASTSSKVSAAFDKLGNKLTNGKDTLTDATLAIEYLDSLDAVLDSSKALMKSAAYNGAQNTKGGKYAEAWKKDTAIDKLSAKEWVASAATGTMGLLGIIGGSVIMAANPIVGGALFALGLAGTTSKITKMSLGAKSFTNEEQMFSGKLGLYNSLVEPANIGDRRAASTYTKLLSGASKIGKGISQLDPSTVTSGVLDIKQVVSGGLSGRANDLYENMYKFANIWDEINDTDFESLYHSDPKAARDEIVTIASSYGTSDDNNAADAKYSGYREEAVNSNLAKDYNEGMEKETNEAVSDKYVKVFKVMLENEPDYIRKVLIAIPKNHSEAEW